MDIHAILDRGLLQVDDRGGGAAAGEAPEAAAVAGEAPEAPAAVNEGEAPEAPVVIVGQAPEAPIAEAPAAVDLSSYPSELAVPRVVKFRRWSREHMQHMREALAKKRMAKLRSDLVDARRTHRDSIQAITTLLPDASKLIPRSKAHAIGRRRKPLEPCDVSIACRAAHLPKSAKLALGVKHTRLVLACARVIEARQEFAIGAMLKSARSATGRRQDGAHQPSPRGVHVTYAHMWDEVATKFRRKPSKAFRARRTTTRPTLVQRGCATWLLYNRQASLASGYREYVLVKSSALAGTSAQCLYPGVRRGVPKQFRFDDREQMNTISEHVNSFMFMPVADKAGSNVAIMKHWGQLHESETLSLPRYPKILYWPEVCGIHLHHRAKLQVKRIRSHVMRHYGIAQIQKLQKTMTKVTRAVEVLVRKRCKRKVGPSPAGDDTFFNVINTFFDFSAKHHVRKNGGHSQQWHDLRELCSLVNGSWRDKEWVHWCHDASTGLPCCRSEAECREKVTIAACNATWGNQDKVPAESRWTNTLANFKQSLVRRLIYRVGVDSFCLDLECEAGDGDADEHVKLDGESRDEFHAMVNRLRNKKIKGYYQCDENCWQLGVYVAILEISGGCLLYPLLGNPIPDDESIPNKMDVLLDPRNGKVEECFALLLGLLKSWTNREDTSDHPWTVLEAIGAPMESEAFQRWTRSQILRLSSALYRRYELRLSSWPYKLYALISADDYTEEQRTSLAQELLDADADVLDVYSRGIRRLYPTVQRLLSFDCYSTLLADFRSHPYGIDFIERPNKQMTHKNTKSTSGKNMSYACREDFLQQAAAVHQHRGGSHPLKARCGQQASKQETVRYNPLLASYIAGAHSDACGDVLPVLDSGGDVDADAIVEWSGDNFTADGVVATRGALDFDITSSQSSQEEGRRAGLSVFLLERNRWMQAARRLQGRSPRGFDLIERGIFNFIASVGKAVADEGDLMIMVDGPSVHVAGSHCRRLALVTGTTYNPHVFDVTEVEFDRADLHSVEVLELPCDAVISTRACKMGWREPPLGTPTASTCTSDEWIAKCLGEMKALKLHRLTYVVITPTGSLEWSRITQCELLGDLWADGVKSPLTFGTKSSKTDYERGTSLMSKMLRGDPFDEKGKDAVHKHGRGQHGGRGRGAARGRAGRSGRGRAADASVAAIADAEPVPEDTDGGDRRDPSDIDMRGSEEELSSDGELEAAHAIPDQKADADAAELEVDLDFQKHLERGNPVGSVYVTCSIHAMCKLTMTASRAPDDGVLKQWLFEAPAPPPGATSEQRAKLAKRHMNRGKRRWYARSPPPSSDEEIGGA
ncbi:unnamed protein product [Prorocentrum cordatum]|uniref:Uncharacterized protein n=1 Tax=Prorocentrum cordatum TaxID=2364126 RepID=A0ABN9RNZ7_9DINO|nr:unnamed protein product [Polarella glacialis]